MRHHIHLAHHSISMHSSSIQEPTKWIKMKDVATIMILEPLYQNILFSDNKTNLLDCLSSMENFIALKKFLQNTTDINTFLPNDSPLWPGSTLLHLAVMFSENIKSQEKATDLICQFLYQGASIQVQNNRGETPIHLAFRQEQSEIVALLILRLLQDESQKVVDFLDHDNLSHLHIACTSYPLAEKFLSCMCDIESSVNGHYRGQDLSNVKKGWTPLHVAVDQRRLSLVELLLQRGASPVCPDAWGYTPIHILFGTTETRPLANALFASEHLKDCTVKFIGLTHLHVAVWFDDILSVERLLNSGSNIDAVIDYMEEKELQKFEACTALHMAMIINCHEITKLLLERGADILLKKADGMSPLSLTFTGNNKGIVDAFVKLIWSNEKLQERLEHELGLTMLHIACYRFEIDEAYALLKKGMNSNVKVHSHARFWTGCTPLHLFMKAPDATYYPYKVKIVFHLLIENGCYVDQQDGIGNTTLHLAVKLKNMHDIRDIVSEILRAGPDIDIVDGNGKVAMSYVLELHQSCKNEMNFSDFNAIIQKLLWYIDKLKFVGIEVSEVNETLKTAALEKCKGTLGPISNSVLAILYKQLQLSETIKIGSCGLSIRSFMSETNAISRFPSLTPKDRNEVAASVMSFYDPKFFGIIELFNFQYRKAVARLSLVYPASEALKTLIFPNFPDLCIDVILKYLSNSQLNNLIAAAAFIENTAV